MEVNGIIPKASSEKASKPPRLHTDLLIQLAYKMLFSPASKYLERDPSGNYCDSVNGSSGNIFEDELLSAGYKADHDLTTSWKSNLMVCIHAFFSSPYLSSGGGGSADSTAKIVLLPKMRRSVATDFAKVQIYLFITKRFHFCLDKHKFHNYPVKEKIFMFYVFLPR
jgi:hypothetical protein